MNAQDILKYGHQTVLKALEGIPQEAWELKGVVGVWSLKDVMAHLASFEQTLAEILASFQHDGQPTPTLEQFLSNPDFNNSQVALRKDKSPAEVLAEYESWHAKVVELMQKIPPATLKQSGVLPWYGAEYDLEDFLVYTYYGHKREHSAQIALFKKRQAQGDPVIYQG